LQLSPEQSVAELLEDLGDTPLPLKPDLSNKNVSVERGRDLVLKGLSSSKGRKSRRLSSHFTCLSCHNVQREDPDLSHPDPQSRLEYVSKNDMPFLQGSPLYGIVNRTSFYNGDYDKKYGALVEPTRHDLREAIQLCAVECSQGRPLKDFEMESIVAYLWTIDLKIADLALSDEETKSIEMTMNNGNNKADAIELIKSHYMEYSPATFVAPPEDRKSGDGLKGDRNNGALIYKHSCQHCHFDNEWSFLLLDNSKLTFEYLLNKAGTYYAHSMYQVIRYGTPPKGGKEAYMPQYPKEKMSDQQMADLRAFIESEAD